MKPRSLQDARDDMEGPLGIKGELRASTQGLLVLQPWFLGLRLCLVFGGQCCLTAQGAAEPLGLGSRSVLQKFLRSVLGFARAKREARSHEARSGEPLPQGAPALCVPILPKLFRSSSELISCSCGVLARFLPGVPRQCRGCRAGPGLEARGSRLEDRRWQGSASRFLALRL